MFIFISINASKDKCNNSCPLISPLPLHVNKVQTTFSGCRFTDKQLSSEGSAFVDWSGAAEGDKHKDRMSLLSLMQSHTESLPQNNMTISYNSTLSALSSLCDVDWKARVTGCIYETGQGGELSTSSQQDPAVGWKTEDLLL